MSVATEPEAEEQVGRSIEDEADEPTAPEQMPLPGTRPELSLSAGGDRPQTAVMKFQGGSVNVEGEFEKGAVVRVWAEIVVSEVHFVDKRDQHDNVTGTFRRHIGRVRRITTSE